MDRLPTPPNGKRQYFYGKTKNAVNDRLRRYRLRLAKDGVLEQDSRTVAQFLGWRLTDARQSKRLASETLRSYETKVRLHIKPHIGHIRMVKLTPVVVRQLISGPVAAGLSTKQVNHIHDVLHTALEQARKLELTERNVASLVDPPSIVSAERRASNVEQAQSLLAALEGDQLEPFFGHS